MPERYITESDHMWITRRLADARDFPHRREELAEDLAEFANATLIEARAIETVLQDRYEPVGANSVVGKTRRLLEAVSMGVVAREDPS